MARPLRIEYPGAYYHVTSRGNEQKDIYKSQKDREKFLSYLESATGRYGASIHAWCLMNNHYHLLLETPLGTLSQIMRHINGAYTTYFNTKRKRAGHLFQGRYKAILIEEDEYATELSRYIHLNPVRAGAVEKPEEYRWSSYNNYIGEQMPLAWLNVELILGYFGKKAAEARKKYRLFVEDMLGEEYESPLKNAVASSVLGSAGFIEEITEVHLKKKTASRDIPALRQFSTQLPPEEIIREVKAAFTDNEKLSRQAAIHLCHKHSGAKLLEIGNLFGLRESAVSEGSRRFAEKLKGDKKLRVGVEALKKRLKL